MEQGRLKQRLVGAVVLVALAVIFIPMLLSGGREMEMPVFGSNVPDRNEKISSIHHIDINEVEKSQPAVVNPPRIPVTKGIAEPEIKPQKESSLVDKLVSLGEEEKKPAITKNVWAVQVGSFSRRKNALGLKEKLRKKGFAAFVERLLKDNKATYRVRVGPVASRDKAVALKKKLKQKVKLDGLVVKHP